MEKKIDTNRLDVGFTRDFLNDALNDRVDRKICGKDRSAPLRNDFQVRFYLVKRMTHFSLKIVPSLTIQKWKQNQQLSDEDWHQILKRLGIPLSWNSNFWKNLFKPSAEKTCTLRKYWKLVKKDLLDYVNFVYILTGIVLVVSKQIVTRILIKRRIFVHKRGWKFFAEFKFCMNVCRKS